MKHPSPWTPTERFTDCVSRSGKAVPLRYWSRPCATCGEPFEVAVVARHANPDPKRHHQLQVVNCPTHRRRRSSP